MMIKASVFYPNDKGKIDIEYYMNRHIPLARKLLSPFGLVKIEVDKGLGSPAGTFPYAVIAHLYFESPERMEKGMAAHDPELAADVPNFTDIEPVFQISEVLIG